MHILRAWVDGVSFIAQIIEPLLSNTEQMIWVLAFHICSHLLYPLLLAVTGAVNLQA